MASRPVSTVGDNGSRDLLEKILTDEEQHIDWLEGQLFAIGEMGYENYLAQQLHGGRVAILSFKIALLPVGLGVFAAPRRDP